MIQYVGNDTFDVRVGGIEGEFSFEDLNNLLDELKSLDSLEFPIANRIMNDGEVEKEREVAFDVGYQEGKSDYQEEKEDLDECCG